MHTIKPHKATIVRVTAELILAASEIIDRPRRNGSGSFVTKDLSFENIQIVGTN